MATPPVYGLFDIILDPLVHPCFQIPGLFVGIVRLQTGPASIYRLLI
jgi:hypothetical protein